MLNIRSIVFACKVVAVFTFLALIDILRSLFA